MLFSHKWRAAGARKRSFVCIYDPDIALQIRMRRNQNLNMQTMADIQNVLREHNAFLPLYRQAYEMLTSARTHGAINTDLTVRLHCGDGTDRRRYNLPTSNEVAVILPGDGSASSNTRYWITILKQH